MIKYQTAHDSTDGARWCLAVVLMIISLLYGVTSLNPEGNELNDKSSDYLGTLNATI